MIKLMRNFGFAHVLDLSCENARESCLHKDGLRIMYFITLVGTDFEKMQRVANGKNGKKG